MALPTDQTLQAFLDKGLTGIAILMGFLGCGLVLVLMMIVRQSMVQGKRQSDQDYRHSKLDDDSLRARIEHTKELTRLSDYVNASITSQRSIQMLLGENLSTLKNVDSHVLVNTDNLKLLGTVDEHVLEVAKAGEAHYTDALGQVKEYTSTLTLQIASLPEKLRDELQPVMAQLSTIESALIESQKKTDEIAFLLKGTEASLLNAIDKALKGMQRPDLSTLPIIEVAKAVV